MRYVAICSFANYIEANLLLGRLQEEGINCWLQDEHTVTIDPILTNAIGGIKLMVYFSQVERAAALLQSWQQQQAPVCPCCGAARMEQQPVKTETAGWLRDFIRIFQGKAPAASATQLHCIDCGAVFPGEEA